jgi:hypothetical protein
VLPLPDLDDRRWSDLVDEAQSLIHRYAPGWTDYNVSDPGITLIDLLAWLAEADLFGVNQIPARHRERFLALTGIPLRPVEPARTPLVFVPTPDPVTLPAGVVFAADTDAAASIGHALVDEVTVLGCPLTAAQVWTGGAFVDRTADWRHSSGFDALGLDPGIGDALLLGLDPTPPIAPAARLSLWLGIDAVAVPVETDSPHHGAATVWEFHNGTGWTQFSEDVLDETRSLTRPGRVVLPLGEMGSANSVLGDVGQPRRWLRVRLEHGRHDVPPTVGEVQADAGVVAQAVPLWSTWRYADPTYQPPPEFVPGVGVSFGVRTDARGDIVSFTAAGPDDPTALVLAMPAGSVTLTLANAGTADGAPVFETVVPGAPLVGGSVQVWTADTLGSAAWTVVDTLLRSGPADRHVTVDPDTGGLRFGDGEHGRIPAAGSVVLVRAQQTAGTAGTPTPRTRWRLDTAHPVTKALTVASPVASVLRVSAATPVASRTADDLETGEGRAADAVWSHERLLELAPGATLDQLDRAQVLSRSRPERAATEADFERLALEVPGTAVLRARAWAGLDPAMPGQSAPGTVTVVVVPGLPAARPTPTAGLLAQVRQYLCPRRTLGTRLVVTGPEYVVVAVRAVVHTQAQADAARVCTDAEARLYGYLHPLTGGPAGRGWPFGRDVYASEVLRLLDLVGGVDHVIAIEITIDGRSAGCGNVCVGPTSLVVSGLHEVTSQ